MPQFDVVVFSNELVWVFLVFFSLYSLNYLFFFPRIVEVLKTRSKKIESDLVKIEAINKSLGNIYYTKEVSFINSFLINSFSDFNSASSVAGLVSKLFSLNNNLGVKYFITRYYSYFDFFEVESSM